MAEKEPKDQLGAAEEIAEDLAGSVLYARDTKQWMVVEDTSCIWKPYTVDQFATMVCQSIRDSRIQMTSLDAEEFGTVSAFKGLLPFLRGGSLSVPSFPQSEATRCPLTVLFPNGCYNLKTGVFRPYEFGDYITDTLAFTYEAPTRPDLGEELMSDFLRIFGTKALTESMLRWTAVCLTGLTTDQKFMIHYGPTAANGKSTFTNIYAKVFPLYFVKLGSRTFDANYPSAHVHLMNTKGKRYLAVEELKGGKAKLDTSLVKDVVSGGQLSVRELFNPRARMMHLEGKLNILCNDIPSFDVDAGMRRRGLCCAYRTIFVEKEEEVDHSNGRYLADPHYIDKFNGDEYKLAFFHLLAKCAVEVLTPGGGGLDPASELFSGYRDVCDENESILTQFRAAFDVTNSPNDRVSKYDVEEAMGTPIRVINPAIKSLRPGVQYKCGIRFPAQKARGGFTGIQKRQQQQ
ncbi:hypothetical protein KIPB_011040 [Kipferlia bialata]|uniref:SF3 helicase domain-containing protein n=1 Tax=Kipferlia bialata TaxID=797122 RepID=A0A9K3GN11_9EUKA|nr:hypothetical protein KIPB_011040 [Kipferlia bialata]|eukprot:g11040.t1